MKHKVLLLKSAIILCLFFCFSRSAEAQRPIDLAQRAMSAGEYDKAITYFQKAYEIDQDESITKMINLAQTLKMEFAAVDEAIKNNDFDKAEIHLNNVLIADPNNIFVEKRREEMKQITANQKKTKRRNRWYNFTYGFQGDDDRHKNFGGLHFCASAAMTKYGNYGYDPGFGMQLEYANFKSFPFTINLNGILFGDYESFGAGIGSSYLFTDNFSFDYGAGWQKTWWFEQSSGNHFYYHLGLTYMFNGMSWGGLRYSFDHSINNPIPVSTHKLTYVFGKQPTYVVLEFSLIIGGGIAYYKHKH